MKPTQSNENTITIITRPGRTGVGIVLLAIATLMFNFYLRERGDFPGADAFLLFFTSAFFALGLFCLFTWTRSTLTRGKQNILQETYIFGLFKKTSKKQAEAVNIRQAEMMLPHFILYCSGKDLEDYGLILKLGLSRQKALNMAKKIALFCELEDRVTDGDYDRPEETPKPVDNKLSHLDDEYHIEDGEEEEIEVESKEPEKTLSKPLPPLT